MMEEDKYLIVREVQRVSSLVGDAASTQRSVHGPVAVASTGLYLAWGLQSTPGHRPLCIPEESTRLRYTSDPVG